MVNPANPAKSVADLVAQSRQGQNPIPIASSGIGSMPHLAMELLADSSGAKLLHVPYKGAAPAIADVMGGQVSGFFGDVPGRDRIHQGRQAQGAGDRRAFAASAAARRAHTGRAGHPRRRIEQLVRAVRAREDAARAHRAAQRSRAPRADDRAIPKALARLRRRADAVESPSSSQRWSRPTPPSGAGSSATRRSRANEHRDPRIPLVEPGTPLRARVDRGGDRRRARSHLGCCIRRCSTARRSPKAGKSSSRRSAIAARCRRICASS